MSGLIHWTDDPAVWRGEFEGHLHGSGVAIIFARLEPGKPGPKLHKHPYSETFVVRQGRTAFTAGDQGIEVDAGDIVVVPSDTPHAFANAGTTVLEMMDIPCQRSARDDLAGGLIVTSGRLHASRLPRNKRQRRARWTAIEAWSVQKECGGN